MYQTYKHIANEIEWSERKKTLLTVCMRSNLFIHSLCVYIQFLSFPHLNMYAVCVYVCECAPCQWCKNRWAAEAAATTTSHYQFDTIDTWKRWKMHTRTQITKHMLTTTTNTGTHTRTHHSNQSRLLFYDALLLLLPLRSSFSIPQAHPLYLRLLFFFCSLSLFFSDSVCIHMYASLIRIIFIRFTHFTYDTIRCLTGSCISFFGLFASFAIYNLSIVNYLSKSFTTDCRLNIVIRTHTRMKRDNNSLQFIHANDIFGVIMYI